jgi:transcriptional regulator with XRE-family HTH domain
MESIELIKDRINHILRAKNLTATQFAEMMQIQPSNVSHLLSGRNKPSLDFLIKLKKLFPEYSFDWIILGKKPITINEPTLLTNDDSDDNIETPKFEFDNIKNEENKQEIIKPQGINEVVNVPPINIGTNGLFQIIYVYEDRTFEVYNLRK